MQTKINNVVVCSRMLSGGICSLNYELKYLQGQAACITSVFSFVSISSHSETNVLLSLIIDYVTAKTYLASLIHDI